MPQWAGSCWYYLRYLDPTNDDRLVDPDVERYWMGDGGDSGGVDLYVGGAEHAVLHLLYARFWHKVLFDLGHVSTPEPFHRLYNQGTITAAEYLDERGMYVDASEVEERDGRSSTTATRSPAAIGPMGKSRKNMVTPDEIYRDYGADTLRLYEMFMGPLDASRPWSTADIVGVHRFLQRFWRNVVDEDTGRAACRRRTRADDDTRALLHRTIDAVRADMGSLEFNTAIARLFELNNRLTQVVAESGQRAGRSGALDGAHARAAHAARRGGAVGALGHSSTVAFEPFPEPDPALLVDDEVEVPVQVNGKVRGHVTRRDRCRRHRPRGRRARRRARRGAARRRDVRKVVVVPGRIVNFVVG